MYGLSENMKNADNTEPSVSMRSAGVLFLILGLINLFNEASQPVHTLISTSNIAYVLCLLLGTLLILRIKKAVPFARFAVVAGLVLQGGYLIINGLLLDFMLQLVLCGGLWMVLSPRSNEFKILYMSGILSVSLVLIVDMLLLGQRFDNGVIPVTRIQNETTTAATVDTAFGNAYAYRLDFGKNIWHLRNPENYKKNNPSTDLWLVDPENDSHLMVIGEKTEDGTHADLNAFTAAVKQNLIANNPSARLVDISHLYGVYYDGNMLKVKSNVGGVPLEYVVGLYTVNDYAFQVIGFTHTNEFTSAEPDLVDAIKSFYFDTNAQQKLDRLHKQYPFADRIE